jgi:hypothetical protein
VFDPRRSIAKGAAQLQERRHLCGGEGAFAILTASISASTQKSESRRKVLSFRVSNTHCR